MSKEAKHEGLKKPKELYLEEKGTKKLTKVEKKPTKKHLLDRLNAARKDYLQDLDWNEHPSVRYGSLFNSGCWYKKEYLKALKDCQEAGIEVES